MPRQLLEHLNHELRSPMTVIVGMTDLLLLAPLGPDQKNCLQSVRQASEGLLLLLDELVDFSRLESGCLSLERVEFSLPQVAERAQALIDRSPGTKVPFSLRIDADVPPRLAGDMGRLAQILAGLVRSAAKLRSSKPLVVRVSAKPEGEGRLRLLFVLAEASATFAAQETADDVAQRGEWITRDSFTRDGYRGAGMSLPVAAALAELMDGRLWIASDAAYPVASRFSCIVERPSKPNQAGLMAAIEQQLAGEQQIAGGHDGWHVLLAEDTRANQQFFRTVLEQRGHTVVAVANGQEALDAFTAASSARPYDVVLLDLEMPLMDGRQAATALRHSTAFTRHPAAVVALTAHRSEVVEAVAANGFDALITKPCDLDHFFEVIEAAVRRGPSPLREATAAGPTSCIVDERAALSRLGGSEKLFGDLAGFFLEDAPGLLIELSRAVTAGDRTRAERAAHSLKGLAANFGAPEVVGAAGELQDLARGGDLRHAQQLYERLAHETEKLTRELRRRGYEPPDASRANPVT